MKPFKIVALVLAAFLFGAASGGAAETSIVGGGAKPLLITFDDATGRPIRFEYDGATLADDDQYAFCDVLQGEKDSRASRWVANGQPTFVELKKIASNRIVSVQRIGDWTLELEFSVDESAPTLARRTTVRWNGSTETKIKGFWSRLPLWKTDENSYAFAPGVFPPRKISTSNGERFGAWKRPAILSLANGKSAISYIDFADPAADAGTTEIEAKNGGFSATISWQIAARMKPGDAQTVGVSYLRFVDGDGEAALKAVWNEYEKIGEVVPSDRPAEFSRAILYSFHPGGTIGSNCRDLGGFAAATRSVDRIAELGVNSVWLMPIEDRGIYWPRDYYKFQEGLGTADEYRALIKALHDAGLYVLQDVVPHGGSNEFERAKQHPEQLIYDEDGKTYNYWCFDFNYPTWREYMADVVRYYMTEYGVDGYRVDACGGSKDDNWNPELPYGRASFAKLQGGYGMLGSIRNAVKSVKPINGGILAEVGDGNLGAVADAVYDFDWCYSVCPKLLGSEPTQWVADVRRWLYERKFADPKGLIRMRHIESHDSLRSAGRYGIGAARALMAAQTFLDGTPLVYHEQEIGNADAFRRIFAVRRALPEFDGGATETLTLTVPDGVFAIERISGDARSAVLVNLNAFPVEFSLPVSATEATDAATGRVVAIENGALPIELAPYDWAVWALRRLDSGAAPAPIASEITPENATRQELNGDFATLANGDWSAAIDRATGLIRSIAFGDVETVRDAALDISDGRTETAPTKIVEENGFVRATKSFDGATLTLEYRAEPNGLAVAYRWNGDDIPTDSELIFPTPNSDVWTARTVEGFLRDRLFFRNDQADRRSRHNIYWRELPLETLYDSFAQPFAKDGFASAEGAEKATAFRLESSNENGETRPARFRWLNRVDGAKTLAASISATSSFVPDAAPQGAFRVEAPKEPLATDSASAFSADVFDAPTATAQRDCRLSYELGGLAFENDFYRLRLTRGGAIRSLVAKSPDGEREIFKNGNFYTDYGFGTKGTRYTNSEDVEVYVDVRTVGSGENRALRLRYSGRLRGGNRFALLGNPIDFALEYRLDNSPNFGASASVDVGKIPDDRQAFAAFMFELPDVDSFAFVKNGATLADGRNLEANGRSAQTRDMQEFPDAAELFANGRKIAAFRDPTGDRPANVFLDRKNFFIALYDGAIPNDAKKSHRIGWTVSTQTERNATDH